MRRTAGLRYLYAHGDELVAKGISLIRIRAPQPLVANLCSLKKCIRKVPKSGRAVCLLTGGHLSVGGRGNRWKRGGEGRGETKGRGGRGVKRGGE